MSKGTIYLIQPDILVGTNRYKIGCSKSPDLQRCNSYKKGSRFICIMECINPLILEKKIIDKFNESFKLISGREYFEGDETIMKQEFLKIVDIHGKPENIHIPNDNLDDNTKTCKKIIFPILDSDSDNEPPYEISTYEDYLLTSKIDRIIITNKLKEEGYVKIDKECSPWYPINNEEPLIGWLEKNIGYEICIDIKNNKLCRYDSNKYNLKHYIMICKKYNFEKIIIDIKKKCYNKDIELYILKNYEYLNVISNYCYIIDTKNLLVIKENEYFINNKIINYRDTPYGEGLYHLYSFEDTNINIVNNILKSLIKDDNIIKKYKKLCYNTIVEQKEEIIFYDNDYTQKYLLLSDWLTSLLYKLSLDSIYNYSHNNTINYNIKEIKKSKSKIVFITYSTKKQIDDVIIELRKIGIKNIVIRNTEINKELTDLYDYNSYVDYIFNNKERYTLYGYNAGKLDKYVDDINSKSSNYESIFTYANYLACNFFKWCCTPSF